MKTSVNKMDANTFYDNVMGKHIMLSDVPNLKLKVTSPVTYKISTSNRTGKKIITCMFSYTLNMNDDMWNNLAMNMHWTTGFLNEETDPFGIRTVVARATVSDNDEYSEEKGKSIARAKAESKAYYTLTRLINNMMNKKLKMMELAFKQFNVKSERVRKHNVEYIDNLAK